MTKRYTLCRARLMLPLTEKEPGLRISDGYILTEGSRIAEAGAYTAETGQRLLRQYGRQLAVMGLDERDAVDSSSHVPMFNGVLMPAFVKAHGHDHEQPLIGIAKDEPLTSWLDHAVNPFTGFINRFQRDLMEELGCSPQLATYRMARLCDIHYGITSSMVHHCNHNKYHLSDIARANQAAGTTMIVAVGSQDRNYVEDLLDEPGEAVARLNRALELGPYPRTSFCPGPDQFFSNSRETLIPLKNWAREHGTLFHIHSSEEPATTRWFRQEVEPGMTPVQYANSIGVLDEDTVLAHQVNCGPRDLDILAETGTKVVHNPLANTILGSGMPPVIEMMARGIPVAISTDGSGSADNQNILSAARLAAQYQKAFKQDATLLKSEQLLQMITRIPSNMLGLNQGELAEGRDADWILIDLNRPNMVPTREDNVMENLIWASDGSEIHTVVSKGKVLKRAGKVQSFSDGSTPREIMNKVQMLSERFTAYRGQAEELSGTGAHRSSV
ncbi:MAG: hypothetical protein CR997_01585 [Acidobacteria bacterium]|nr:MAG: hypothetical protein CR997_01585 [Acidobacteriota bacterium]